MNEQTDADQRQKLAALVRRNTLHKIELDAEVRRITGTVGSTPGLKSEEDDVVLIQDEVGVITPERISPLMTM